MHATITTANLTHLLRWTATYRTPTTIQLTTRRDHLQAINNATSHHTATYADIHIPGTATIPTTDALPLLTWLERHTGDTPIRIGTAQLDDRPGTLLTLRTGPNSIRLHTPTPDAPATTR